jgi:hypothetical protein
MPNRVAFLEQTRLPVYGQQTNAARDFYFRTMIQIREPISVAVSSSFRGRATAQQVRRRPCPPYANCSYGLKVTLELSRSAGKVGFSGSFELLAALDSPIQKEDSALRETRYSTGHE